MALIAIDTNILVRALTGDDPVQSPMAVERLQGPSWISLTVLLETEWVLRSAFGWGRTRINAGLRTILRLSSISLPAPKLVSWALDRHAMGADLADTLHLVGSTECAGFLTFDRALAHQAGETAPVPIEIIA